MLTVDDQLARFTKKGTRGDGAMLPAHIKRVGRIVCVAVVGLFASGARAGDDTSIRQVEFRRDIQPILERFCLECHGASEPQGQLRLLSKSSAVTGGLSGPAIVPRKPDESLLYQRITEGDSDLRMPHDQDPLSAEIIALIRSWIEQGADWPDAVSAEGATRGAHWAYVKPARPRPPSVHDAAWVRNPIDAFVRSKLESGGLSPSPDASREQLLRRVFLDLTGLPPTLIDCDAFLADPSPDAYEKVVDRLLASPHYGERWAQPWLDAARYADSNGFTNDRKRSIWPYRDWVIGAINADMPFNQFTIEQIAGDMLPGATISQRIATGFHRNTMFNDEQGVDQGEARWNAMVDRVGTTATVWLGTTLACAQCHNHKYDPFSQRDFYGLLAFFENVDFSFEGEAYNRKYIEPILDLTPLEQQQKRRLLENEIAELSKKLAHISAPSDGTESQKEPLAADRERLEQLTRELETLSAKRIETMVMRERRAPGPLTTYLRIKGSYLNKGENVQAAVPAALHPLPPGVPRNRLSLAHWLVDPENPLTARVIVNRYWAEFFGHGLVETEEDFGTRGAAPSHPELLDWLATEFMRLRWSTKQIHKTILMSATYRQCSTVTPELLRQDPNNRLLARGPRFRLNAEFMRDTTLAISGLLCDKMGGPGVFPPQPDLSSLKDHGDFVWTESKGEDRYRRAIYTFWRRSALYPALSNFDAPTRETCAVKRIRSNTPLQALTLLNDQTAYEAALALAKRIRTEAGSDDASDRAAWAFRLCTCRKPSGEELRVLVRFYENGLALMNQDQASAQKISSSAGEADADFDLAGWFLVSQALLNLDETLSKE